MSPCQQFRGTDILLCLTNWDVPSKLDLESANAAATAEQKRHITYHKVSQSHLPSLAAVERRQGGRSEGRQTGEEGGPGDCW